MIITTDEKTGRSTAEPETPEEKLALEYLAVNRPIFAVAESYVVSSFIAGYKTAKAEVEARLKVLTEADGRCA